MAQLIKFSTDKHKTFLSESNSEEVQSACESFMIDTNWAQMAKKRRTAALNNLDDSTWMFKTTLFGLILEGTRQLYEKISRANLHTANDR